MKLRFGYVSNSSSSSFICAITGEEGTYYTDSPKTSPIVECHECGSQMLKEFVPNCNEVSVRGCIEKEHCPICRLKSVFKNNNILGYWNADKVEKILEIVENIRVD